MITKKAYTTAINKICEKGWQEIVDGLNAQPTNKIKLL